MHNYLPCKVFNNICETNTFLAKQKLRGPTTNQPTLTDIFKYYVKKKVSNPSKRFEIQGRVESEGTGKKHG